MYDRNNHTYLHFSFKMYSINLNTSISTFFVTFWVKIHKFLCSNACTPYFLQFLDVLFLSCFWGKLILSISKKVIHVIWSFSFSNEWVRVMRENPSWLNNMFSSFMIFRQRENRASRYIISFHRKLSSLTTLKPELNYSWIIS